MLEMKLRFINSKSSEEIIFTKNATEAINLVASSYGTVNIQNGDEIIISMLEHPLILFRGIFSEKKVLLNG